MPLCKYLLFASLSPLITTTLHYYKGHHFIHSVKDTQLHPTHDLQASSISAFVNAASNNNQWKEISHKQKIIILLLISGYIGKKKNGQKGGMYVLTLKSVH